MPSISDCVFAALLLWVLLFTMGDSGLGLLQDSQTGYHIRTGDFIREHKAVPREDIFSFSRPRQPWYAFEWLCAVLFSALYSHSGLKGVIILAGTVIALANLVLLRHMLWRGANFLVAVLTLHLGIGAASIHYLARPHIFTLLFMAVSLFLLDRDRRHPTALVWLLIPLTALWVNLHPGFLAWIACLGIIAAGSAVEAMIRAGNPAASWRRARRYAFLAAACLLASGLNPYGFREHAHAVRFLTQKWPVRMIQEYQSPRFNSTESLYFEILLFSGVALTAWLLSKKKIASALLVLAWGHLALTSTRHIAIFVFVSAPLLAGAATVLWDRWTQSATPGSVLSILTQLARDHIAGVKRTSIWAPLLVLSLFVFDFGLPWPTDLPQAKFPVSIVSRHRDLLASSRVFTTDSWGDYLTFRFYPRQKIFVDGRSDFFGQEILEQSIQILNGHYGWEELVKRYDFSVILIPSQSGLASLLRANPGWRALDGDGQAVLFQRTL